jgi:micrococcal nuclease
MAKRKETVTKVIDGDSFFTSVRKKPVRLANVDTPEKRQPGYQDAKKALEKMVLGQKVEVNTQARDVYGRAVAKVKVGTKSINNAMKKYKKK